MAKEQLDLASRRKLYEVIRQNPGIHYRELERLSGLASGTLEYNLHAMERSEIINTISEGGYTRYFISDARLSANDKRILSFLRLELPRGIMLYLILNPDVDQATVAEHFSVTRPTVTYHLKRMEQAGVVEATRDGRRNTLRIVDEDRVASLVVMYRPSFVDVLVDAFLELWYKRE